jgi:hypothetical protein
VKEILNKTGEVFKTIGIQQANFETTIHHVLDEGKINKSTQDYFQAESEMNELKRRVGQHSNGKNRFEKEQKKLDVAKETNDPEYEKELENRTIKAEVGIICYMGIHEKGLKVLILIWTVTPPPLTFPIRDNYH